MRRFLVFATLAFSSPIAAQEMHSVANRLRQERLSQEFERTEAELAHIRGERILLEARIEGEIAERASAIELSGGLVPAKAQIRTTPVPAEIFLVPKTVADRRPQLLDSLTSRGAFYAGYTRDDAGLEVAGYAIPYVVVVKACGSREQRQVPFYRDRMVVEVIHVRCRR